MLSLSKKTAYDMSHSVCLVHFPPGFPGARARMAICVIYHKSKSIFDCFFFWYKMKVNLVVCVCA